MMDNELMTGIIPCVIILSKAAFYCSHCMLYVGLVISRNIYNCSNYFPHKQNCYFSGLWVVYHGQLSMTPGHLVSYFIYPCLYVNVLITEIYTIV